MSKYYKIFGFLILLFLNTLCNTIDNDKSEQDSEIRKALLALLQQQLSVPSCQTNSTGTVYFVNSSNTNRTYDVLLDGVLWATVPANNKSQTFTIASGTHTLLFRFTNTSTQACTQSTPNIAICSNTYYSCSG